MKNNDEFTKSWVRTCPPFEHCPDWKAFHQYGIKAWKASHGRFGRPEEVTKIGKREDTVRLGGKNLHHSAHALVAADFVHGGIAPLSVVECESRCN